MGAGAGVTAVMITCCMTPATWLLLENTSYVPYMTCLLLGRDAGRQQTGRRTVWAVRCATR